jgi:hypothetical protein
MRNIILKIVVVILFIAQVGIGYFSLIVLGIINIKHSNTNQVFFSKEYTFALIIFSILISLLFVVVILAKVGKIKTVIKEVYITDDVKSYKTPKQKKGSDLEQKNQQLQNEKKKQLVNDTLKNLNTQLSIENYTNQVLINISRHYDIFQGIFFVRNITDNVFRKAGTYAYYTQDDLPEFSDGVGLTGQVAANKKLLNISNIPNKYITVLSGLGKSSPSNLLILPIIYAEKSIGVIELASFIKFDAFAEQVLTESALQIGQHISEILAKPVTVDA